MQLKEDDAELNLGLAQLLQQRMRRRRAPRRYWVRPWIVRRENGVSVGTSDASPSFWEAYLSSNVAKIKNTAILNEVLSLISALKLNAGQGLGSYLWLTRTRIKLADNSCIVV